MLAVDSVLAEAPLLELEYILTASETISNYIPDYGDSVR